MGKFNIIALSENTLDKARVLYNKERHKNKSLSFFKKKYSIKWLQLPLLGFLGEIDGKVVCFRGSTLYNFSSFIMAQCGDAIVAEEYRGKGYFTMLVSKLEQEAQHRNIDGIFVFPNKLAERVYLKRKYWENIGSFYNYKFNVKTFPLLKVFNKIQLHWLFFFFIQKKIDSVYENPEIKNKKIGVEINKDYLDYKDYGRFSCLKYGNKNLLWSLSDGLLVLYSEVQTYEELEFEISFLNKFCKRRGIHKFAYSCYTNSKLKDLLDMRQQGEEEIPVYYYPINKDIDPSELFFNRIDKNAFDL